MLFKQNLLLPTLGFKNAAIKMNTRDLIHKIFPKPQWKSRNYSPSEQSIRNPRSISIIVLK